MIKKAVLLAIFVLVSYSAYSQTFEDFRMFNGFTENDTTATSTDYVRINKYVTVDFNLVNGVPTDGHYINTSDYSFHPAISYVSFGNHLKKAPLIVHPQINYENNLMKFYSFAGSQLIVMNVLNGGIVFNKTIRPHINVSYGYTVTDSLTGDNAFVFDYSFLPDGAYFVFFLSKDANGSPKMKISAAGLIEKPKCDLISTDDND